MPVTDVTTDAENLTMAVVADFAAPIERVWSAYSDLPGGRPPSPLGTTPSAGVPFTR